MVFIKLNPYHLFLYYEVNELYVLAYVVHFDYHEINKAQTPAVITRSWNGGREPGH